MRKKKEQKKINTEKIELDTEKRQRVEGTK